MHYFLQHRIPTAAAAAGAQRKAVMDEQRRLPCPSQGKTTSILLMQSHRQGGWKHWSRGCFEMSWGKFPELLCRMFSSDYCWPEAITGNSQTISKRETFKNLKGLYFLKGKRSKESVYQHYKVKSAKSLLPQLRSKLSFALSCHTDLCSMPRCIFSLYGRTTTVRKSHKTNPIRILLYQPFVDVFYKNRLCPKSL